MTRLRNQGAEQGITLVEVTISGLVLAIVLAIVGNYLISTNRTVSEGTAQQNDNATAQRVLSLLEANIRYACNMSINGGTLYVANAGLNCTNQGQPVCAEWSSSGGQLTERTSVTNADVIANGVSGVSFTQANQFNGLVTAQFTIRQPQDQASDPIGVTVNQTLTARNMSQSVLLGTALSGCP